ncbi:MAG: Glutamate/gamma-aminobutyrate antiporter [Chlamydiae bacterium]|nr:Glutamate/gamma-aminobutyrate antiporter [Chlamydiota bacterium]
MNTQKKSLNTFLLTGIFISTILSIRNWPLCAQYGLSSLVMILVAFAAFLIPVALVSAELATGWPEKGGIFSWIREAFGYKWGFAATWFVWISNVVWYPTILAFIGASITYCFSSRLAANPVFLFFMIVICFWVILYLNLKGTKISGLISSVCLFLGTIIPGALIILFACIWIFSGHESQMTLSASKIMPKITGINDLVFFAGLLLGFSGMEMPAVHVNEVDNPKRNFPRAIFLSSIVIIVLSILGTFSIGVIIPQENINLVTAPLDAIAFFLNKQNLSWVISPMVLLIAIGAFGGVSTWVMGPSKSLLEAAKHCRLPAFVTKTNDKGMPFGIFMIQGVVVTLFSFIFLIMPDLNSSFWILTALTSQLYLIGYLFLFTAAIYLRYKRPEVKRKFTVSKSNAGMWFVCGVGILSSFFTLMIGFFPPSQISMGSQTFYVSFLIAGIGIFSIIPFLLSRGHTWSPSEQAS